MFCSRSANNKINKLHERALRIVYDDYNSKFEELLTKDGSFTTHHKTFRHWKQKCLQFTMDFHKSLFWIYFIIITFTVYNLNPTFKSQELTLKRKESVR